MELLAAIWSAEPPSILALAILAFSAALYPAGLMLGASCSKCCCPGEIPFYACGRDLCLSCDASHGLSFRIPDNQTGAVSVCAQQKIVITLNTYPAFMHLAAGETFTFTVKQATQYSPDGIARITPEFGGAEVPALFSVTVHGVDIPFASSSSNFERDVNTTSPRTDNIGFQSFAPTLSPPLQGITPYTGRASVSAAVSVHVRAVRIAGGSEYLSGESANELSLLAMLQASAPTYSGQNDLFLSQLVFTPNSSLFEFLPISEKIRLEYTVELKRGGASTFRNLLYVVQKQAGEPVTPIPQGGISPPVLPTYQFENTATLPQQNAANGTQISIFSNNPSSVITQGYFFYPQQLEVFADPAAFPPPSGALLQSVSPASFAPFVVRSHTCSQRRFVFAPLGVNGGQYEYDYDKVDEFLAGDRCFEFNSGANHATGTHLARLKPGKTYRRCIEPPSVLCGLGLCSGSWLLPHAVSIVLDGNPLTFRVRPSFSQPPFPGQSCYRFNGVVRTRSGFFNPANGWAFVPPMPPLPTSGFPGGGYDLFTLQSFYDGDLLHSLEHGPSRGSVGLYSIDTGAGFRNATATLEADDDGISFATEVRCPNGFLARYPDLCCPLPNDACSSNTNPLVPGTAEVVPVASSSSVTPQNIDWRGGGYAFSTQTGGTSYLLPARSDWIQSDAQIAIGGLWSGSPYKFEITQGFRPCAAVGWVRIGFAGQTGSSMSVQKERSTHRFEIVYPRNVPCEQAATVTANVNWIEVVENDDERTVCVTISENTTGSQRSGKLLIGPMWRTAIFGLPAGEDAAANATLGTFEYVITQSA